ARRVLEALLVDYPDHAPALAGLAVVLARLGERDLAHRRAADALERDSSGITRYQAACAYALTSRQQPADARQAIVYLRQAIDDRFGLTYLGHDTDLD